MITINMQLTQKCAFAYLRGSIVNWLRAQNYREPNYLGLNPGLAIY